MAAPPSMGASALDPGNGIAWADKAPFRRAAKWDGVVPTRRVEGMVNSLSADEVRDIVAFIGKHRTSDEPFDVVIGGHTVAAKANEAKAHIRSYSDAGTTWWLENISPGSWEGDWPLDAMNERVSSGPPRG